ncbi:MAG: site-specific integrase, partial [Pseudomonas sp.]
WDAVDLERGFLRLADTKTGKSVHPLGAAAIELLTTLTRAPGSPYVLPGAKTGTHLEGIKRLWFAVRYAAGLDDVRLHDLRHSFASTVAVGGDSLTVIRSLLGHSDISTTQRYAHLGDDPVKSSADRASEAIAGWLAGRDTPVEPMRGRKKAGQGPRRMLVAANHARVRADDTTAMNTTPR